MRLAATSPVHTQLMKLWAGIEPSLNSLLYKHRDVNGADLLAEGLAQVHNAISHTDTAGWDKSVIWPSVELFIPR